MKARKSKRWHRGKPLTLLVSLLAVLGIGVSGTLAYLFVLSDNLNNSFNPTHVTSQVVENFNETTKSNVQIQNTGTINAWIRVALVATWEDGTTGNAVNKKVLPGDLTAVISTGSGSGWFESGGYYYCTEKIAPNGLTPILLNSVVVNAVSDKGYRLNYQILCEAIQAEPAAAVHEAWPAVSVDSTNQTLKAGG